MILSHVAAAVAAGARIKMACDTLGIGEKTIRRWRENPDCDDGRAGPRHAPSNKLTESERARIVDVANSPEFRDLSPKQIVPSLADRGLFVASESSFYRVLGAEGLLTHRGRARARGPRRKPVEYVATGPRRVWTWDITYLRGPIRGTFFYLYLFLDIYSRKIVAAEVFATEDVDLAAGVFKSARAREGGTTDGLVLHADNGGPMKSATMLATLQRLGTTASFSRPRVSDDNPYSEALFRTLKYSPKYPRKPFASLEDARKWVANFVEWYNTQHLHSALRFVTPNDRHEGRDGGILRLRKAVYAKAKRRHPRRWTGHARNWSPVGPVTLNPSTREMRAA